MLAKDLTICSNQNCDRFDIHVLDAVPTAACRSHLPPYVMEKLSPQWTNEIKA